MIPNDCSTATVSPRRHDVEVRFSISTSASQPVFVTAKRSARKTSAGPWAGERSTQCELGSLREAAGPGGSGGVRSTRSP